MKLCVLHVLVVLRQNRVLRRLAGRFGGSLRRQVAARGQRGKVDAPELSSGPGWEIEEVSRVGAQPVTSKSQLLAREMPRVCSAGLQVESGADAATWR